MGWVLDGEWDRAVHPTRGLTGATFPRAMAQICKGINNRLAMAGESLLSWKYTDALDVEADYPTAEQIAGANIGGRCYREFFTQAHEWCETYAEDERWHTDANFDDAIDAAELWESENVGVPAADIDKGPLWAPNWVRIKNVLDRLVYVIAPADVVQAMLRTQASSGTILGTYHVENEPAPDPRTPEQAWEQRFDLVVDTESVFPENLFGSTITFAGSLVTSGNQFYRVLTDAFVQHEIAGIRKHLVRPQVVQVSSTAIGTPLGIAFTPQSRWDEAYVEVKVNGEIVTGTPRKVFVDGPLYTVTYDFIAMPPPSGGMGQVTGVGSLPDYDYYTYGKPLWLHGHGIMTDLSNALEDQI